MRLSRARRVLAAATAVIAAAGVAAVIDGGGDGRDGASLPETSATVQSPARVSGHDLAAALSQTTAIRTSPSMIGADTLGMVASQQGVETERAWLLAIPGDDRTAWLFVGLERAALVVPRTVVDPERGSLPDATSIFGAQIEDLANQPLVASQAGGGQEPRTLILVPDGVDAPRIVARDSNATLRQMPHRGRLYADQIQPGEELVVGKRRIGPTTVE